MSTSSASTAIGEIRKPSEPLKPFGFDSAEDALGAVVAHLGGYKVVAARLWPPKDPDAAGRKLANCLNANNPEKLDLEEIVLILKWGRAAGCDTAMHYIARIAGYSDPKPIDPIAEAQRIESELVVQMDHLQNMFEHLRQMKAAQGLGAA